MVSCPQTDPAHPSLRRSGLVYHFSLRREPPVSAARRQIRAIRADLFPHGAQSCRNPSISTYWSREPRGGGGSHPTAGRSPRAGSGQQRQRPGRRAFIHRRKKPPAPTRQADAGVGSPADSIRRGAEPPARGRHWSPCQTRNRSDQLWRQPDQPDLEGVADRDTIPACVSA